MTTKEVEKIRTQYMAMLTSPKFSYPPKTKTEAMIAWLLVDTAIDLAEVVQDD